MINYKLEVSNGDITVEIFLNKDGEVYIGRVNEEDPLGFYMTITKEDWPEIRKHIDKLFKELDQEEF